MLPKAWQDTTSCVQVLVSPYSAQEAGVEAKGTDEGVEAMDAPGSTNNGEEADEATLAKKLALEEMRKLRQDPRCLIDILARVMAILCSARIYQVAFHAVAQKRTCHHRMHAVGFDNENCATSYNTLSMQDQASNGHDIRRGRVLVGASCTQADGGTSGR
jgi:hypothetical protein